MPEFNLTWQAMLYQTIYYWITWKKMDYIKTATDNFWMNKADK